MAATVGVSIFSDRVQPDAHKHTWLPHQVRIRKDSGWLHENRYEPSAETDCERLLFSLCQFVC